MKRIITYLLTIALMVSGVSIVPVKATDTLSPDDWKTVAIASPLDGDLIGAGHIDVKWNNTLENVKSYSVYVDSKLIKTVNATSDTKMSVDFYTVKVSAHTTYIVAEQNDGTKVTTPTNKFYVTKKGICVNNKDMGLNVDPASMNLGWYYDWGTMSFKEMGESEEYSYKNPNPKFDNLEFVPMFWSNPKNGYTKSFAKFKEQGYKYVLFYNEPDLSVESNKPADYTARTWRNDFMKNSGKMLLGSPAVSVFPQWSDWWKTYWSLMPNSSKQATNFIAVHNYQKHYDGRKSALQYLEEIDECYNTYRKPIWITEFAVWKFGKKEKSQWYKTQEFMKIVLKGLNERSYVERYSWFSTDPNEKDPGKDASSSSLFDYKTGALTTAGKIYAQIGNPAGYPAKTYGVSSTINQNTSIAACVASVETHLNSLTGKKKAFKYDIQAVKGAVGYQLQYSLNKKFSKKKKYKTKTKNLGAAKSSSKIGTIKKLKKKKRYYVRARAIKQILGKKYYCAWSGTKKVKTKKK